MGTGVRPYILDQAAMYDEMGNVNNVLEAWGGGLPPLVHHVLLSAQLIARLKPRVV